MNNKRKSLLLGFVFTIICLLICLGACLSVLGSMEKKGKIPVNVLSEKEERILHGKYASFNLLDAELVLDNGYSIRIPRAFKKKNDCFLGSIDGMTALVYEDVNTALSDKDRSLELFSNVFPETLYKISSNDEMVMNSIETGYLGSFPAIYVSGMMESGLTIRKNIVYSVCIGVEAGNSVVYASVYYDSEGGVEDALRLSKDILSMLYPIEEEAEREEYVNEYGDMDEDYVYLDENPEDAKKPGLNDYQYPDSTGITIHVNVGKEIPNGEIVVEWSNVVDNVTFSVVDPMGNWIPLGELEKEHCIATFYVTNGVSGDYTIEIASEESMGYVDAYVTYH